jgi:hypothetical protein
MAAKKKATKKLGKSKKLEKSKSLAVNAYLKID